ncbi:DUF945 family protein [Microbulbifer sp. YPW16]|uniref:DUF945 family protein n=1 Tax=Microbulbifer sp. YPW16 TaxID=2904242 RepID=UPI001E5034FB|nr:DUF945 family protein [Microbulbifer sp. YPW16]UHQ54351.1 YdgA family protein [Microbulbifer sp. YPW16]
MPMKLLKISLLALTFLLVVVALAAPGFIGPQVEQQWQQQFARLQGADNTGYQRGWFGAEAGTRVSGRDGDTRLRSEIQHGPVVFTAAGPRVGLLYSETRLSVEQLAPALRTQLEKIYGRLDHSPAVLESLVGADNRVRNVLRLEPFTRSDSGGELSFGGAEIVVESDYAGTAVAGTLEIGAVQRRQFALDKFSSAAVTGRFSFIPGESGELSLSLPELKADSDAGPVEIREATLALRARRLDTGNLEVHSDLQVPQVQSATPVSSLQQQVTLPDIALADLGHFLHALLLVPAAERDWPEIMRRPLQLQQQAAIQSANGPMLMDLDMDWRGMPAGMRPAKQAPGQWLQPLVGTMTFTSAEQALMQSPLVGQAIALREYGLLLQEGDELQMLLEVNRGDLRVNGQQLPPDLFMLALGGGF